MYIYLSFFFLPSSLVFLAHSCSLFPSRAWYTLPFFLSTHMPSLSLSPFRWRSSSSLLFQLRPVLFALFLTPPCLAHVPSFLFVHLSLPLYAALSLFHLAYLSFFASRLMLPLAFALSFHMPLYPRLFLLSLYPLCRSLWKRTSLSSRSIELWSSGSFYLAQSSYFLLFFFCAFSLLRLSFPLSLSRFISPSRLILRVSAHERSASRSQSIFMFVVLLLLPSYTCVVAARASLSYAERWCETHRTLLDKFAWH